MYYKAADFTNTSGIILQVTFVTHLKYTMLSLPLLTGTDNRAAESS